MTSDCHDIRLLAGFEIEPASVSGRALSREQTSQLAVALADDLARAVPGVEHSVLMAAGSLLEPLELLRPGLPAWDAMLDLSTAIMQAQTGSCQVVAIGTHGGRWPDRRLAPPDRQPQGRFVGLPLLLRVPAAAAELEERIERELFERGGVTPPARALLEQFSGAQSVHGQLLTVNDLLALQHVQMDTAGLSAFWSVIEQILLVPDETRHFDLPLGLGARWNGPEQQLEVAFVIFDRFDGLPEHDPAWQRAYRTLTRLADAHGLSWQACCDPDLSLDSSGHMLTQEAGQTACPDGLTEHGDAMLGLIAWTLVEQGRMRHLYPLSAEAASRQRPQLLARFERVERMDRLPHNGQPPRLCPA